MVRCEKIWWEGIYAVQCHFRPSHTGDVCDNEVGISFANEQFYMRKRYVMFYFHSINIGIIMFLKGILQIHNVD